MQESEIDMSTRSWQPKQGYSQLLVDCVLNSSCTKPVSPDPCTGRTKSSVSKSRNSQEMKFHPNCQHQSLRLSKVLVFIVEDPPRIHTSTTNERRQSTVSPTNLHVHTSYFESQPRVEYRHWESIARNRAVKAIALLRIITQSIEEHKRVLCLDNYVTFFFPWLPESYTRVWKTFYLLHQK